MDDVLILLTENKTQDSRGAWHSTTTPRSVFCKVSSITQTEFFEAGRNGLNPQFRFTVFFADYQGETLCEYKGKPYSIYRTYQTRSDYLELYAERQGGSNGKKSDG